MSKSGSGEEGLLNDIFATPVPCKGEMPTYATAGSAGCDLRFNDDEEWTLSPFERKLIPTGTFLQIPKGHFGMVCPRSGLAVKHGVTVINAPGIIDSDYRGEIHVPLINLSHNIYEIKPGERIAQLVIMPFVQCGFLHVEELDITERGTGGFGSSGKG